VGHRMNWAIELRLVQKPRLALPYLTLLAMPVTMRREGGERAARQGLEDTAYPVGAWERGSTSSDKMPNRLKPGLQQSICSTTFRISSKLDSRSGQSCSDSAKMTTLRLTSSGGRPKMLPPFGATGSRCQSAWDDGKQRPHYRRRLIARRFPLASRVRNAHETTTPLGIHRRRYCGGL
jgi:hypothetical protein